VSLIEPGPIRTDMWEGMLDDYDAMAGRLTERHRELYASHLAGNRKLLRALQKRAGNPRRS
jgi:hypothetical protein